jgi:hypothetical protein
MIPSEGFFWVYDIKRGNNGGKKVGNTIRKVGEGD